MKDIKEKLIRLFHEGYCTPQISRIAKKIKEPSATIHYNIKKLEKDNTIKSYKAVFDYKKIGKPYCAYVLINLSQENYWEPENVAKFIVEDSRIESVDVITGDYELLIKVRTKDIDEYYELLKLMTKKYRFEKAITITSLKQLKTEFCKL